MEYLNYKLSGSKKEDQQLTLQFDEEAGTEDNDFAEKTDVIFQLREKLCDDLQQTGLLALYNDDFQCLVFVIRQIDITYFVKFCREAQMSRPGIIQSPVFENNI